MDDGVDIGEVNIKDGVGLGGTVAVRDGIHARQILRSLEEIVRVGHGQGRAAQRDGAVLGAHVREHALADALKARTVGCGGPATDDDLLLATHLAHQATQEQRTKVIREHVDDLSVFEIGNHGAEHGLMAPGAAGDDNVACTLDCLFNVGCYNVDECAAAALKAVTVALDAIKKNSGFIEVLEGFFSKRHYIVQTDFATRKLDIRCAGLTDSATAQNGDRHIFQIFHFAHYRISPCRHIVK